MNSCSCIRVSVPRVLHGLQVYIRNFRYAQLMIGIFHPLKITSTTSNRLHRKFPDRKLYHFAAFIFNNFRIRNNGRLRFGFNFIDPLLNVFLPDCKTFDRYSVILYPIKTLPPLVFTKAVNVSITSSLKPDLNSIC